VLKQLEEASKSKVEVGGFHGRYFPRPGCVLEHVIFRHNPESGTPPLISIDRLRIDGSFTGLFTRHVKRILAEGRHIVIPSRKSGEHFETPSRSTIVVDELIADGGILEIERGRPDKPPLQFAFRKFTLGHVGAHGPASFHAMFSNPKPPGEITTSGKLGPWNADEVGKTPVSGEYMFEHADLGARFTESVACLRPRASSPAC
jgi:hypothetical protein